MIAGDDDICWVTALFEMRSGEEVQRPNEREGMGGRR